MFLHRDWNDLCAEFSYQASRPSFSIPRWRAARAIWTAPWPFAGKTISATSCRSASDNMHRDIAVLDTAKLPNVSPLYQSIRFTRCPAALRRAGGGEGAYSRRSSIFPHRSRGDLFLRTGIIQRRPRRDWPRAKSRAVRRTPLFPRQPAQGRGADCRGAPGPCSMEGVALSG